MTTVLLITNDAEDAMLIQHVLADLAGDPLHLECLTRLSDGVERLSHGGVEAVLVNLSMPGSHGIEAVDKLLAVASHVPILILCDSEDEDLTKRAIQRGAQDCLLRDRLDRYSLPRAIRGVIQLKTADEALFVETDRAQVTLNSIGDGVISTDMLGRVTYLNSVAENMTGWSEQEALGRPLAEVFKIIDGTTRESARDPMQLAIQKDATVALTANCILIRRDGYESAIEDSATPIHDRRGRVAGAVMVFHDVSGQRAMVHKMSHLAQHDVLTDLPNRMLLNDRLTQAFALGQRHRKQLAVLFLDLDRFKHINDSLGHSIGDKLLRSIAQRLVACVRSSDTVSRQGGDEFVVLLSEIEQPQDAARCAEKLLRVLTAPHSIEQHDLHVTASIGISICPQDGRDAETLIRCADTAMYHAKENGRDNYQFFTHDMNARAVERQSLEASLRRALEREEFVLHYQPKINLKTGAITGAEALIRWQHPERGLVLPAQFVPLAEDCGLIVPIGQWVVHEACRQSRAWLDAGGRPMPMAVNISAAEFRSKGFVEGVRTSLKKTCLRPGDLELELTESVLMHDAKSSAETLQELKTFGVQFAVDDFGTGYSSLSYLRRFPIDVLKIDQSFVQDITTDPSDATIVTAIIHMAKGLKQRVIAEGVETPEQLAFLRGKRCSEGQGYHFSRPVPAADFAKLVGAGGSEQAPNDSPLLLL